MMAMTSSGHIILYYDAAVQDRRFIKLRSGPTTVPGGISQKSPAGTGSRFTEPYAHLCDIRV